jgi:glutaredoxin
MEEDIPMVDTTVTVYGAHWCPDCRRSKKFLGEQFIPFKWVDIEQDKEGELFVIQKNGGKRIIPTIVFGDGSLLVEPSNAELAKKLGLKTEARKTYYDLTIVGGGPAGLRRPSTRPAKAPIRSSSSAPAWAARLASRSDSITSQGSQKALPGRTSPRA